MRFKTYFIVMIVLCGVMSMAPGRCGVAAQGYFSGDPAPDVRGQWDVTYDDTIEVSIDIGGEVVTGSVFGTTNTIEFQYEGEDYVFELDCDEVAVVCPSEIFADTIRLEQRDFEGHPHQVNLPVNETTCRGGTRVPDEDAGECGGDTDISCEEEICDGMVSERSTNHIGSISAPDADVGDTPEFALSISLGGLISGFSTGNGVCVGLAASEADAIIDYDGSFDPDSNSMTATDLVDGNVSLSFAGGCLIAASGGGTAAGAISGASVTLSTGFTASRR